MVKLSDLRETYVASGQLAYDAIKLPLNEPSHRRTAQAVSPQDVSIPSDFDFGFSLHPDGLGLVRINSRWLNRMR